MHRPYSNPASSRPQSTGTAPVSLPPPAEDFPLQGTDGPSAKIFNPIHHVVYIHEDYGIVRLPIYSYQVEGNVWGEEWKVFTLNLLTETVKRAHSPWDNPDCLEELDYRINEELFGPEGVLDWEDLQGLPSDHLRMKVHRASSITEAKSCLSLGLNHYPDGIYYVSFIFEPWRGRSMIVALEFLLKRDL